MCSWETNFEKKELFTLIEVCLSISYIHFDGRILNLTESVNGHCILKSSYGLDHV